MKGVKGMLWEYAQIVFVVVTVIIVVVLVLKWGEPYAVKYGLVQGVE